MQASCLPCVLLPSLYRPYNMREGVKEGGREEEKQVNSTQGIWKERYDMGYVEEEMEVFIHSTQMGGSIQWMMDD